MCPMPGVMPAAAEAPFPFYGGAPDDTQPTDLPGALAIVDSIIWRDGGMDMNEQQTLFAWVQQTIMKAEAQQMAMQQGMGQSPDDAAGLGSSSATSEFTGGGGQGAAPAAPNFATY